MIRLGIITVDAGLLPLRYSVFSRLQFLISLHSLKNIDDAELVQLIITKRHPIIEGITTHLTDLILEVLEDSMTTIESHIFLPWIGPKVFSLDGEAVAVVHDEAVCDELM